jgi:ferrous iron transport protein B
MHRLGMHGQAVIPIVLGFGCNVPAVMSIRLLRTRRERFIASFLVTMVPCSARTVVIAGVLAAFVGLPAAFSIYLIIFVLLVLTGFFLSRIAPGEQFGMIMEMAPLRLPQPGAVIQKAWRRIREFLVIAMPLLIVTSVALGVMEWAGIIDAFQAAIAPFSETVLGLPSYASTALLFGILRKEMALGTLVVLAGTPDLGSVMSSVQLYTFALVSTLFVPCVSTLAVLHHQMGWKVVIAVTLYTFVLGVILGACINIAFG